MQLVNVHQRLLRASPERVSELLASLGSPGDRLWPRKGWPRMRLDGPVAVGAAGGHGPIRYRVEAWEPGRLVRFRFTGMRGVDGWHAFEILDATPQHCVLEHRMEARLTGMTRLQWACVIRPLLMPAWRMRSRRRKHRSARHLAPCGGRRWCGC
jgi:hypothetical protein